ncbi:MAG: hypothetical protein R3B68_14845 [Phycisphaerales bacterium]
MPIDPWAGVLEAPIPVGVNPNILAVSDNGQYLYAGLDGEAAIQRVDLASRTPDLHFGLGIHPFSGSLMHAEDIEVVPGSPESIVVSRRNFSGSPRHEGVAVFDGAVQRPITTPRHTGSNRIEFGNDPSTLYGYNNEATDFGFRTMRVDSNGVETVFEPPFWLFVGFELDFVFDGQWAIATSGQVIDPVASVSVGEFWPFGPKAGSVVSDPANDAVFFLAGNVISIYDRDGFVLRDTIVVPGASSHTFDLWRWGADGLAFRDAGTDRVWLVNGVMVPAPHAALVLAPVAVLRRTRRSPVCGGSATAL